MTNRAMPACLSQSAVSLAKARLCEGLLFWLLLPYLVCNCNLLPFWLSPCTCPHHVLHAAVARYAAASNGWQHIHSHVVAAGACANWTSQHSTRQSSTFMDCTALQMWTLLLSLPCWTLHGSRLQSNSFSWSSFNICISSQMVHRPAPSSLSSSSSSMCICHTRHQRHSTLCCQPTSRFLRIREGCLITTGAAN